MLPNGICTIRPKKWDAQILWDFHIQMDHLILARRPDLVIVNKKKRKKEKTSKTRKAKREINTKTLQEKWQTVEHERDGDTNWNWGAWYSHQRIGTGTEGLGNKRTSGDHPNYSIVEISQHTKKSPGDSRKFAVTQTLVENYQLTLEWKTLKLVK